MAYKYLLYFVEGMLLGAMGMFVYYFIYGFLSGRERFKVDDLPKEDLELLKKIVERVKWENL